MNDFTLTDGKLIDLGLAANVRLGSCHLSLAEGQTPTAAMISLSTGAGGFGSLDVAGCALPSGSPDPFWTIGGAGNWSVRVTGSCTVDRTGQTVARLTERAPA